MMATATGSASRTLDGPGDGGAGPSVPRRSAASARTLLEFVKIEHSLFALPFVLGGLALGLRAAGGFSWRVLLLALVSAVAARTLAMTLNRIVDRAIDARNPRTAMRALPSGAMTMRSAWTIAAIAAAALIVACVLLNWVVLALAPVLVALFFAYPYAKRVTWACHFVLGLAFLCAPVGGYLAASTASAGWLAPFLLGLAAMAWVSGFDILYALLDVRFDRAEGIHSIPARFGAPIARRIAGGLHVLMVLLLAIFARAAGLGWPMYVAVALVGALLVYEHATADPSDPVAINKAFFNVNAVVGWIALAGLLGALWL